MLAMRLLIGFTLLLLANLSAFSQVSTWVGSNSSSWTTPSNWTGPVPGAGSTVNINNASAPNMPVISADVTVGTLNVSAGTLNLNGFKITATTANISGGTISSGEIAAASIAQVTNTTFTGSVILRKTGSSNNTWSGNNTFNGATQIINAGSANLTLAGGDNFNSSATISNFPSNNSTLIVASTSNINFFGSVQLNNTAANGVAFGTSSGSVFLNGSSALSTSNFNTGSLSFTNVFQEGPFANGTFGVTSFSATNSTLRGSITINSSGAASITNSTFSASFTITASNFTVVGPNNFSTASGAANFTKTGSSDANWSGGNTFGPVTITNNGSGHIRLVETGSVGDTFQGTATFNNSPSNNSFIRIARSGTNTFAGNITLVNPTSTGGIRFGESDGTSVQSTGGILTTGFANGLLQIDNFTQQQNVVNGSFSPSNFTATNTKLRGGITIAATGNVTFVSSEFDATNSFTGVNIINSSGNGSKFSLSGGNTTIRKTGGSSDDWISGNEFGDVTIINQSGSRIRTGNSTGSGANIDVFYGNATFQRTGSGEFSVGYNRDFHFKKDVSTLGSTDQVLFGRNNNSTGWARFNGSQVQTYRASNAVLPLFHRVEMANKSGLVLQAHAEIRTTFTFTTGEITASSSAMLIFWDKATHTGSSDSSHVNGPVRAIGDDAFVFPIGAPGIIAQIGISNFANASNSVHFTAEYYRSNPRTTFGTAKDTTITNICSHEYWMLDRTNGTPNVEVTLYFAKNRSCDYVESKKNELKVIRWNGTQWVNHGNSGVTGVYLNGTIKSLGRVTSFSPFTIGDILPDNVLPIRLKEFYAEERGGEVNVKWTTLSEIDVQRFEVEKSLNGIDFETIASVPAKGGESTTAHYLIKDLRPSNGDNFYRLVEVDPLGVRVYHELVKVKVSRAVQKFLFYPSPLGGNHLLHYNGPSTEQVSVEVYNLQGMLVSKILSDDSSSIDLYGKVTKGLYLGVIRNIKSGQIIHSQRIIVN
jgi:hypothetical protein